MLRIHASIAQQSSCYTIKSVIHRCPMPGQDSWTSCLSVRSKWLPGMSASHKLAQMPYRIHQGWLQIVGSIEGNHHPLGAHGRMATCMHILSEVRRLPAKSLQMSLPSVRQQGIKFLWFPFVQMAIGDQLHNASLGYIECQTARAAGALKTLPMR